MKYIWLFTWLFVRTKLASICGLTAVCNRVNKQCFANIVAYKLFESKWSSKQGSKTTITPKNLVELSSFSLFLKHLLHCTKTAIWKPRHRRLNISVAIISARQNVLWIKTPQYSFLYLVTWHQNLFTTVTHFLTISFTASTKLVCKTYAFLGI